MRQHTVPRCYLREFANKGYIYSLNVSHIKKGRKVNPVPRSISSVCVDDDYYTIQPEEHALSLFGLDDVNELYVEQDVLSKEESKFPSIFHKLITIQQLSEEERLYFSDFILQLKMRNPSFRKNVIEKNKGKLLENADKQFETFFAKLKDDHFLKAQDLSPFTAILKERVMSDPSFSKKISLHALMLPRHAEYGTTLEARESLKNASWTLLEASPECQHSFITTDNPGFVLNRKKVPVNLGFGKAFSFYLPLTSRHCLIIEDLGASNSQSIKRKLVTDPEIDLINMQSSFLLNQVMIGEFKTDLQRYSDFYTFLLFSVRGSIN